MFAGASMVKLGGRGPALPLSSSEVAQRPSSALPGPEWKDWGSGYTLHHWRIAHGDQSSQPARNQPMTPHSHQHSTSLRRFEPVESVSQNGYGSIFTQQCNRPNGWTLVDWSIYDVHFRPISPSKVRFLSSSNSSRLSQAIWISFRAIQAAENAPLNVRWRTRTNKNFLCGRHWPWPIANCRPSEKTILWGRVLTAHNFWWL